MQAIHTRYLPATNFTPARIVAECSAMRRVYPYDHAAIDMHAHAAMLLHHELGQNGYWPTVSYTLASGTLKDGSGVHVLVPRTNEMIDELDALVA